MIGPYGDLLSEPNPQGKQKSSNGIQGGNGRGNEWIFDVC